MHIKVGETLVYQGPKIIHSSHSALGSVFPCFTVSIKHGRGYPVYQNHTEMVKKKKKSFIVLIMLSFQFSDLQLTGIILRAAKRFQINIYVEKIDDFM